ncbi:MAG: winged helix-turn-helix domain-containing protein, partial [Armatimonadetes bacterium]|nr:winged helix-turn-helix domain-containing protein [Armatimonadota bacterium]
DAQFVALAAPFGQADRVAEWLGAQLVEDWARPVVLRVGVLHNGVFTYRSQGCSDYGHEELPASGQTWAEMAASLAARLAENEQPTIVFVRDKASALAMARRIASSGRLRPASGLLEALRAMNGGTGTQTLRELAAAGVVVHHGDLRAEEREAIEKSFRDGDLMAVVATSTLAVGVNMPARNVIIDAVRWKSPDEPSAKPLQEPLPHADFLAMAGRAGRLGTGDQFGRAILIAETPLERDVLMKTYVDAEPPLMRPALAELCPDDAVVVLGSSFIAREQGLHAAWARSLTAHLAAHSELPARHAAAATRLQLSGFLDDSWRPTALLRPAAGGMVDAATLRWLASLRDAEYEHWNWLAVLLLCCASPEAARLPFPLHHTELREHDYVVQVTDWALERSLFCSGLSRALTRELLPVHQAQRAAKMCLAMLAWLGREPVEDVELKFHVPAGRLETIASLLSWLMQLAADIAEALGWPKAALDPLRDTAAQLRAREIEARARESYLPPQSSAGLQPGCPPLPAAAANAGGSESEAVSSASEQLSGEPVPAPGPARPAPPERAQPPMLILDTAQPDTVTFRGASFRVTPCEFRLLWKLAEAAGACVAADRLGNYVFGPQDYIAPYQLYSHISRLRKKMEAASGREADGRKLIESVPRRGWRLNIPSAQIRLVGDEAA